VALRVRLGEALASESPAVRAAAVEALGRAVASPVVLAAIAASSTPGNVRSRLRPVLDLSLVTAASARCTLAEAGHCCVHSVWRQAPVAPAVVTATSVRLL
jgi:hypothetical protein